MTDRLARKFYRQNVVHVARRLLGQRLVRVIDGQRLSGLIVEVEAYLGIPDQAAHTCNGRHTARNASMWTDGGHAYVYFTYGMHHCLNVVAGNVDQPVAVLLRAIEPVTGKDLMYQFRNHPQRDTDLCSGPAKLCQALAINRDQDGLDLTTSDVLFIERIRSRAYPSSKIVVGPRVGVAYAGDWALEPLRFSVQGNPHVSRSKAMI